MTYNVFSGTLNPTQYSILNAAVWSKPQQFCLVYKPWTWGVICSCKLCTVNAGRLTSLALKSLHDAMISQWVEILYIPVEILNRMALWLSRQQNEDGAFIETSEHFYDRSFWVNGDRIYFCCGLSALDFHIFFFSESVKGHYVLCLFCIFFSRSTFSNVFQPTFSKLSMWCGISSNREGAVPISLKYAWNKSQKITWHFIGFHAEPHSTINAIIPQYKGL